LNFEEVHANILIGLLRLRKISKVAWLPELTTVPCSIMRELHVYGTAVAVSARDLTRFQYQGYGILLMEEAERIARKKRISQIIRHCWCRDKTLFARAAASEVFVTIGLNVD